MKGKREDEGRKGSFGVNIFSLTRAVRVVPRNALTVSGFARRAVLPSNIGHIGARYRPYWSAKQAFSGRKTARVKIRDESDGF